MSNRQAILDLIALYPNIRSVELADRLDMEPERVRPLIEDDIKSGQIVEEEIRAPNGCMVASFRHYGATPKASAAPAAPTAVPARVARALPPAQRAQVVGVPVFGTKADPLVPEAERKDHASRQPGEKTRVQLAIEHLAAATGPVKSRDLAVAMGIGVTGKPRDYLGAALRGGRVAYDDGCWTLGDGSKPSALAEGGEIDVPVTRKEDVPLVGSEKGRIAAAVSRRMDVSRVQRAIDHMRAANQPVTTAELRKAMGLVTASHPSNYLATALRDGRVVHKDGFWTVGGAPQVAEEVPAPAVIPEPAIELRSVAPTEQAAPRIGGTENYPVPPVADGAPDISRPGLYENGQFRAPPEAIITPAAPEQAEQPPAAGANDEFPCAFDPAAVERRLRGKQPAPAPEVRDPATERFLAGVLSDGSLHLRIPGRPPVDLPPEDARTLYEFLKTHGYAAWPKQTA